VDYTGEPDDEWSLEKLYSRGQDGRRILFLELIAWAITQAEEPDTRGKWDAFTHELTMTRDKVWGKRPWPNAIDNETFLAHVRRMAEVFANSHPRNGVTYEGRRTNPLAP
jgi:hypothetical protein